MPSHFVGEPSVLYPAGLSSATYCRATTWLENAVSTRFRHSARFKDASRPTAAAPSSAPVIRNPSTPSRTISGKAPSAHEITGVHTPALR